MFCSQLIVVLFFKLSSFRDEPAGTVTGFPVELNFKSERKKVKTLVHLQCRLRFARCIRENCARSLQEGMLKQQIFMFSFINEEIRSITILSNLYVLIEQSLSFIYFLNQYLPYVEDWKAKIKFERSKTLRGRS